MRENRVSDFMLERYRLGEISAEDKKQVEDSLDKDELASRLEDLSQSDRQLLLRYPASGFKFSKRKESKIISLFSNRNIRVSFLAAAVLMCVVIPMFIIVRFVSEKPVFENNGFHVSNELNEIKEGSIIAVLPQAQVNEISGSAQTTSQTQTQIQSPAITSDIITVQEESFGDRTKGQLQESSQMYIFLKGDGEVNLSDQSALSQGNTVQLAYMTPAGSEYYGVIFSIDGRSDVTMHYPYRRGQSTLLSSGRRTFLNEAYTLDDAPEYEVFVFVVSQEPLDVQAILWEAARLAENSNAGDITDQTRKAFKDCEIETITIKKTQDIKE